MRYHKLKAGTEPGTYVMESTTVTEHDILTMAQQLSQQRLNRGKALKSPTDVKDHMRTLAQNLDHEVFSIVFLDTQHRIIKFEQMFRGCLDSATVYPREIVKMALACNAAAVILTHNHPSGNPTPSKADIAMTRQLKEALKLVSIHVLDHIVVGVDGATSMVEHGLM